MVQKLRDEYEALMVCREKVLQRGLPMEIVDAEYQWCVFILQFRVGHLGMTRGRGSMLILLRDRRKLSFYYKCDKRVDFRELTKDLFRQNKVGHCFV
jgi:cell fate regulator YaaT (PSP1 superfamily)